ncbi:MAG: hypothetical protein PVI75_04380 [Gammaproteobacteria bacterium]|jgi:hypothetical protein
MQRIINWLRAVFFILIALFCPTMVWAQTGLGSMAESMVQGPLTIIMQFIDDACYVAGIILILVGFNKYLRYRQNPQETPISTPIVYFLLGVAIILLPFVYYLVQRANA